MIKMMEIKAIPTEYKGYKFRSRLEARWAVFFDTMGYEWVYEPEGFELENGTRYLPDFIIDNTYYVEIKPVEFNELEILKCKLLAKQTKKEVLMLVGIQDYKNYDCVTCEGKFEKDSGCNLIFIPEGDKYHPFYYNSGWDDLEVIGEVCDKYHLAVKLARQHRFKERMEEK